MFSVIFCVYFCCLVFVYIDQILFVHFLPLIFWTVIYTKCILLIALSLTDTISTAYNKPQYLLADFLIIDSCILHHPFMDYFYFTGINLKVLWDFFFQKRCIDINSLNTYRSKNVMLLQTWIILWIFYRTLGSKYFKNFDYSIVIG